MLLLMQGSATSGNALSVAFVSGCCASLAALVTVAVVPSTGLVDTCNYESGDCGAHLPSCVCVCVWWLVCKLQLSNGDCNMLQLGLQREQCRSHDAERHAPNS